MIMAMMTMMMKLMFLVITCIVSPLHDTLRAGQSIWKLNFVVELCDLEI